MVFIVPRKRYNKLLRKIPLQKDDLTNPIKNMMILEEMIVPTELSS